MKRFNRYCIDRMLEKCFVGKEIICNGHIGIVKDICCIVKEDIYGDQILYFEILLEDRVSKRTFVVDEFEFEKGY